MDYKKSYFRALIISIIPAAFGVLLNILCLLLRTDENHFWMLGANVLTDWICGVFLVYYICCRLLPRKELYRLSRRTRQTVEGVVDRVDFRLVRYERINCYTVYMGPRQLFAPENMALPQEGQTAVFQVAGNVILEVAP